MSQASGGNKCGAAGQSDTRPVCAALMRPGSAGPLLKESIKVEKKVTTGCSPAYSLALLFLGGTGRPGGRGDPMGVNLPSHTQRHTHISMAPLLSQNHKAANSAPDSRFTSSFQCRSPPAPFKPVEAPPPLRRCSPPPPNNLNVEVEAGLPDELWLTPGLQSVVNPVINAPLSLATRTSKSLRKAFFFL